MTDIIPISSNLLSAIVFLPLCGAIILWLTIKGDDTGAQQRARFTALFTTLITFALSLYMWSLYDPSYKGYQFTESMKWLESKNITYSLGVDGISIYFIILNCFLMPICILASWNIEKRVKEYLILFLGLQACVNGVFASLNLVLFYILFEGMLIPMYMLIGIWGGERRVYAAYKFFLYTLLGSVLFLVAIMYLQSQFGSTHIPDLTQSAPKLPLHVQQWLWLALFASFAVKVPMWPVHTWLPDAHVQAPTAGSVILAGILLKLGGYGFLRLSIPFFPDASHYFAPMVIALSIIAIIYTSLVALAQTDMKKLIAYSSVAHMGFVTIGMFSFTTQGIEGSIFQMISHGLVSGALFLCVGVLYDRMHTKEIARYGGVANRMPYFAAFFLFLTMASVGLPGTSGFVGEFLSLLGIFKVNSIASALAATGVVLGAGYMLMLYRRVMFGAVTNQEVGKLRDINTREALSLAVISASVLMLGVYPEIVLGGIRVSTTEVLKNIQLANNPGLSIAQILDFTK